MSGCLLLAVGFAICLAEWVFRGHAFALVLLAALVLVFAARKR